MKHLCLAPCLALCLLLLVLRPAAALDITQHSTPRGLTLWFVPDHTTPTVTISFAFRGGSERDPPTQQGRAFLLAQALTEGTTDTTADVFQQLLQDRNISLSFTAGREQIGGTLRYLRRHEEAALELAHSAIHEPAFRAADVTRLQAQMLASLKRQSTQPDFRAARLMMTQVFGANHPYAQAARGTPATIKNLTPASLRAALRQHFTKNALLITVVGALSAAEATKIADRLFADLPSSESTPLAAGLPATATRQNLGQLWYSPWAASEQNSILFSAPALPPTDPDYPAALILNDLMGAGGFRARLMETMRQELGATYGISANLQNFDALDFTLGQTSVAADTTDKALEVIRDTWAEALDAPFSSAEIAVSKNYLASSFSRDLTSSMAVANYVQGLQLARLPPDYAARLTQALQAVTDADLARVAARLYQPADLSFVVVGPTAPAGVTHTVAAIWDKTE